MENWLHKRVMLTPHRVAVEYQQQTLTFLEVEQKAIALAHKIASIAENELRIGLITTNNINGYLMIMALQQLGKQIVFINRRLSVREVNDQITDADLHVILVDNGYSQQLDIDDQISFQQLQQCEATAKSVIATEFPDDFVTSIMYTSGTTGKAKGVMQTYGNHFYSAIGSALNLGLTAEDEWLTVTPIFHISGFSILMRALLYGMRVVLVEKFNAHDINQQLKYQSISAISVVPTMLKALLADLSTAERYNAHFRTMLLGGGPIDCATLDKAREHGIPVIQSYGMTETASQVVALNMQDATRKIGSAGKPLFPVSLKIANQMGQPVEKGLVWLKTPTLTVGYLNRPYQLEQNVRDGWFNTEDFGYLDSDGFLYIEGREGDMISSGGENIFPDEVEKTYLALPDLEDIVVLGIPDNKWGQVPVAFVKGEVTGQQLYTFGQAQLAHYKVPTKFYQLSHWPRTASGKIQRKQMQTMINQATELEI